LVEILGARPQTRLETGTFMILPDQTPKLPKWPFLVGDAALLGAAWLIASDASQPLAPESAMAIAACVICAAIAGAIPFLTDYARRQDEALDNRQRSLEALARTSAAAAEQISIAAAGLRETTESAERSLGQARELPEALRKEIAEFGAQLARSRAEERKAFDKEVGALRTSLAGQIEAATGKLDRAAAELEKAMAELKERSSAPTQVVIREVQVAAPPVLEIPKPEVVVTATPEPDPIPQPAEATPEPASFATGVASEATASVLAASEATAAATEPAPEAVSAPPAPKPPRKRAPRKAPVAPASFAADPATEARPAETTSAVPAEPPAPAALEPPVLELESPPAASSEFSQASPDEDAPTSSLSADGATRLLVTAYIGIGNRLFVRGEGPGLSWDRGVPLQFVSIGKWRWDTTDAAAPVRYKLYKNDEIECPSLGTGALQPGQQQEVTAVF
jgi:hypothetical protein